MQETGEQWKPAAKHVLAADFLHRIREMFPCRRFSGRGMLLIEAAAVLVGEYKRRDKAVQVYLDCIENFKNLESELFEPPKRAA